jgi:3',5'-cyclic AMP phosphodiesterase CpdA
MRMSFCHLSDTHIMADTRALQHGVNPYDRLRQIIAQICTFEAPPAFVILTGDLINDDDPQSYRNLKRLTDRLPVPTYFALGNHDLRQPFRQILLGETTPSTEPYYYAFETAGYRFIVLDSLVEGEIGGALDAAQLSWLADTLAAEPHQPTVVFVHHPPVPTGVDWLDAHVIANGTALLDVLGSHGHVRQVFFGHVHMPVHITVRGLHCTSVPSTCYQFGDTVVTPKVLPGPSGYSLVQIQGERINSRVILGAGPA